MTLWLALLSAFGCALCNGIAAVLQKISADKETKIMSLHAGPLLRLLQDRPYVVGIILDIVAWILTLVAAHSLPLFIVQPIIAFSVVVTVSIESLFFHRKLTRETNFAIGIIVVGLFLLATTGTPETATNVSPVIRTAIISAPLLLAVVGVIIARIENHMAMVTLAAVSGLAFGGTAVTARMLHFSPPYWHTLISPPFLALLAYGLVGILSFTIALQRHHASVVNAVMITFETIAPIGIGLLFLGDSPRHGLWALMILGACVVTIGSLLIAIKGSPVLTTRRDT